MKKINFGLLIVFLLFVGEGKAQTQSGSLKLLTTISLPDVRGRIDHLSFDSKHQLIFVSALGNNSIEVVNLQNKRVTHTIRNLSSPQGIVYIPENNSIFVANGGNGVCDVFNATSFQKIHSMSLASDADNVRYDSTNKKIYVGYGNGGIAIINATTFALLTKIKLMGHPESFQIDKLEKKIYVNVPDEKQIDIVDLKRNKVVGKWKMTEATSNFPMSLDETNHRLFIGCRYSPTLLVIDTQTGKVISSLKIDSDVDDIYYDKPSNRIYLSCGGGYIDIFKQINANKYVADGRISTRLGARTSLLIPTLNQLIVASPLRLNDNASLLIYSLKQ